MRPQSADSERGKADSGSQESRIGVRGGRTAEEHFKPVFGSNGEGENGKVADADFGRVRYVGSANKRGGSLHSRPSEEPRAPLNALQKLGNRQLEALSQNVNRVNRGLLSSVLQLANINPSKS